MVVLRLLGLFLETGDLDTRPLSADLSSEKEKLFCRCFWCYRDPTSWSDEGAWTRTKRQKRRVRRTRPGRPLPRGDRGSRVEGRGSPRGRSACTRTGPEVPSLPHGTLLDGRGKRRSGPTERRTSRPRRGSDSRQRPQRSGTPAPLYAGPWGGRSSSSPSPTQASGSEACPSQLPGVKPRVKPSPAPRSGGEAPDWDAHPGHAGGSRRTRLARAPGGSRAPPRPPAQVHPARAALAGHKWTERPSGPSAPAPRPTRGQGASAAAVSGGGARSLFVGGRGRRGQRAGAFRFVRRAPGARTRELRLWSDGPGPVRLVPEPGAPRGAGASLLASRPPTGSPCPPDETAETETRGGSPLAPLDPPWGLASGRPRPPRSSPCPR